MNSELEKDAWEPWDDELYAEAARELAANLRITYRDANGQVTHRSVSVQRYSRTSEDGGIMVAYCHLRQSRRPFRFSRILHAADLDAARRIDNLGEWLDSLYANTPRGARDRFVEEHRSALNVLLYVARADEAFRAKEKAAMAAFCRTHGLLDELAVAEVLQAVANWAHPSKVSYGKDLRSVAERELAYRATVWTCANDMVNSDKTVRENEIRALKRMKVLLDLPDSD